MPKTNKVRSNKTILSYHCCSSRFSRPPLLADIARLGVFAVLITSGASKVCYFLRVYPFDALVAFGMAAGFATFASYTDLLSYVLNLPCLQHLKYFPCLARLYSLVSTSQSLCSFSYICPCFHALPRFHDPELRRTKPVLLDHSFVMARKCCAFVVNRSHVAKLCFSLRCRSICKNIYIFKTKYFFLQKFFH